MICPNCGAEDLWRDSADVGVGVIYGPYGCDCGWSEWDEYNQLIGNGGVKENGAYEDPYGGFYPVENPVAKAMSGRSFMVAGKIIKGVNI